MSGHNYIGLTDAQLDAVISTLAVVMNDPTWVYEPGRERALRAAFTALTKAAA